MKTSLLRCLYFTLFATLACSPFTKAQTTEEFPLRPAPSTTGAATKPTEPEQLHFRTNALDDRGLNRMYTHTTNPTVTVYRPAEGKVNGLAMVVCPGGGYSSVVIDREGFSIARYFRDRGWTLVVLKYRVPRPEISGDAMPYPQQDALDAIRYARAHAAEWGVRPDRIGIMGSSAGGHLAGSTAFFGKAEDGSRPDFVALLYPVITMDGPYVHKGSRGYLLGANPAPERVALFSLEKQVRAGLPPFFITHAKDDKVVPVENSTQLIDALKKAGVPAKLVAYEKGSHGFSLGRGPAHETDGWKAAFMEWVASLSK